MPADFGPRVPPEGVEALLVVCGHLEWHARAQHAHSERATC